MSSLFRNLIVPAAKNVGKSLLKTGLRKASNVIRDVADGKNALQSAKEQIGLAHRPTQSARGKKRKAAPLKRKAAAKRRRAPRRQNDIFDRA
jgi:hypothetical protein